MTGLYIMIASMFFAGNDVVIERQWLKNPYEPKQFIKYVDVKDNQIALMFEQGAFKGIPHCFCLNENFNPACGVVDISKHRFVFTVDKKKSNRLSVICQEFKK